MNSIWGKRLPGLGLILGIALLALQIHRLPFPPFSVDTPTSHPIDAIFIAIILGMLLRNVFTLPLWFRDGIQYAVKGLLPLGIILLGAQLNFFEVLRVSLQSLLVSTICVLTALFLTYWLCVKAGISKKLGFLIGVGTAICGGTAIVVMAPVIEADESDTALSVATVTLFGMIAIFVFPALGTFFEMTQIDFGIWVGVAVHATPQVIAAGFAYGTEAGEIGTIVKLVRVLMLVPLTIFATLWYAQYQRANNQVYIVPKPKFSTLVPAFIFGFIFMAIANTFYFLPEMTLHLQENFLWSEGPYLVQPGRLFTDIASFLITMAMAGIGLGTDLQTVRKTGFTPLYVGLFSAIVLSALSFLLIRIFI